MRNKLSLTHTLLMGALLLGSAAYAADDEDNAQNYNASNAYNPEYSNSQYSDQNPDTAPTNSSTQIGSEDAGNVRDGSSPFATETNKSSVPVFSGGVGDEEMANIRSVQNQYSLKLLITEKNGTFLSDVDVHIADMKGHTLVDTSTQGPILLAKLPAGKYKVEAMRHEESKQREVVVKKGKLNAYQITFSDTDPKTSGDPQTTTLN